LRSSCGIKANKVSSALGVSGTRSLVNWLARAASWVSGLVTAGCADGTKSSVANTYSTITVGICVRANNTKTFVVLLSAVRKEVSVFALAVSNVGLGIYNTLSVNRTAWAKEVSRGISFANWVLARVSAPSNFTSALWSSRSWNTAGMGWALEVKSALFNSWVNNTSHSSRGISLANVSVRAWRSG